MSDFISPLTGDRLTPAEAMLFNDSYVSVQRGPKNADCYICNDPDFARMGLPLCNACIQCGAHVPADDDMCDNGHNNFELAHEKLLMEYGCSGLA